MTVRPERLLLDTHAFIWLAAGGPLGSEAERLVLDEANEVLLSLVSVWEMAIKSSLGRLVLHEPLREVVRQQIHQNRLAVLDVRLDHVLGVEQLPWVHRDPFDRLLVSQALAEGLTLVSRDEVLDGYGVTRVW